MILDDSIYSANSREKDASLKSYAGKIRIENLIEKDNEEIHDE